MKNFIDIRGNEHGLDSDVTSIPIASPMPKEVADEGGGCPNCKCKEIMLIKVEVEQQLLKGKKGTGTYVGCPACPWASPMVMVPRM